MKYPQLVSTRAVNAISDWLVSRLEQLGVEAPQIYTRLLLSLLQSSVQINDPNEFSNLETFIGNRKGGSIRRYLQCDANTLKKLNAVQCLSEIVSSEQELTTIENLVDELWEKLKDIEKQLDYSDGSGGGGETILVDYLANSKEASAEQLALSATNTENSNNNINNNNNNNNNKNEKISLVSSTAEIGKESETDPKKRYFNAFPALSKEMEDSFRIWRRNAKSLTWPADRSNVSTSSNNSDLNMSTSFRESSSGGGKAATEVVKEVRKNSDFTAIDSLVSSGNIIPPKLENFFGHANYTTARGLRRKTKRRKSQPMSKDRTMQNVRRSGLNENILTNMGAANNAYGARRQNRHMSPTQWDTDFEGYWEMGRDLIKEFFAKQGDKNRKRCSSANGAYAVDQEIRKSNSKNQETKEFETIVGDTFDQDKIRIDDNQTPPLWTNVDISFCCDDDDTYKSIAELTADTSLSNFRTSPRRLYERMAMPERDASDGENAVPAIASVQTDLVQFEAKFNSNVAALWQDASDDEGATSYEESSLWSAPNNIPWPNVAPIKENLKNFWTTFYNQFDSTTKTFDDNNDLDMDTNGCASLPYSNFSSINNNNNNNNNNDAIDFHSMPNNFDKRDGTVFANSKRDSRCKTPLGVFLQDSIWSENFNGDKNTDTDESFYLKVWNSNKKLYNLDAVYETKITEPCNENKSSDTAAYQYMNYGKSKWSEGINAGPTMLQQQKAQSQQQQLHINVGTNNKVGTINQQQKTSGDCTDASVSTSTSCSSLSYTLSSSGIFSGQTPSMQQNPQSSWAGNPDSKSLTEMYGINSPIEKNHPVSPKIVEEIAPSVSLANHSNESSGFAEYSRLKSLSHSFKSEIIKQQQRNYQTEYPLPKPQRYPEDENLLTSERTHFQPIKAYADGYTFDVCSALDVINYKRSESGYLYFESEKYLEYTRNDSFMAEETDTSAGVSAAPLYAGSNCEAATAQKRKKERKGEELVLKFRIMNREMACQTDDEATIKSMYEAQQHPLYLIFSGASTDGMKLRTSGQACSDALEALNKAVAAAAAAAAERDRMQLDTPWLRLNEIIGTSRNALGTSLIWTAVQKPRDEIGVDEIDFCNESSSSCTFGNAMEQQWSMNEFSKRCQQHNESCISGGMSDNNNSVSMQHNNGEMHSLWGMCAACNSDYDSAPANNLLRDELNSEADQIMSDLKNMQDLYIGCGAGGPGECIDSDSACDFLWGRQNETSNKEQRRRKITQPKATRINENQSLTETAENDDNNESVCWDNGRKQKETHQKVLQQVNKLIADLMRPEKANDTNVLADAAASAHRELGESLWPDDGEHNIWKHHLDSCNRNVSHQDEKRNSNSGARVSRNSLLGVEENRFLSQLTWDHDNLAELWAKETPPLNREAPKNISKSIYSSSPPSQPPALLCSTSSNPDTEPIQVYKVVDKNKDTIKSYLNSTMERADQAREQSQCNEQTKPVDQQEIYTGGNRNNDPLVASAATYKRIQQLLNSSSVSNSVTTAKLKLANRKRRHSASQNYAIFHNGLGSAGAALYASSHKPHNSSNNNNNNNNNNNAKVTDLNNFNFKRNALVGIENSADPIVTSSTNLMDDVDMEQGSSYDPTAFFIFNNGDGVLLPPKQTIITCKYWTTIDPMTDVDPDNIDCTEGGTTFSCLMDKNDTILKHVTMLARPLTR